MSDPSPSLRELTRSEQRSWRLHQPLASALDEAQLQEWRPALSETLARLRDGVRGEPHQRNLERWASLIEAGDVAGICRVLTGLDRDSIEMREVSPFSGLLSDEERREALRQD